MDITRKLNLIELNTTLTSPLLSPSHYIAQLKRAPPIRTNTHPMGCGGTSTRHALVRVGGGGGAMEVRSRDEGCALDAVQAGTHEGDGTRKCVEGIREGHWRLPCPLAQRTQRALLSFFGPTPPPSRARTQRCPRCATSPSCAEMALPSPLAPPPSPTHPPSDCWCPLFFSFSAVLCDGAMVGSRGLPVDAFSNSTLSSRVFVRRSRALPPARSSPFWVCTRHEARGTGERRRVCVCRKAVCTHTRAHTHAPTSATRTRSPAHIRGPAARGSYPVGMHVCVWGGGGACLGVSRVCSCTCP